MKQIGRKIKEYAALFLFFWIFLVVPLFFENKYFNMLEAKAHVYAVGAIAACIFMLVGFALEKSVGELLPESGNILDLGIVLFGVIALISCLLSGSVWESFWGLSGWRVGAFTFATFALFYRFLASNLKYRQNLWIPVLMVNVVIFILGICHSMGVDILGMHEYINPGEFFDYLSTIGQKNGFAGYLCLTIPLVAAFFLSAESAFSRNICLVFLIPALLNMVLCASDGLYLGIGMCAFFAVPYVMGEGKRIRRIFALVCLYGCALFIVGNCPLFSEKTASIEGISGVFLHLPVTVGIIVIGIVGLILAGRFGEQITEKTRRRVTVLLEILLILTAAGFLCNMIMTFSDSWGTHRGRTWKYSISLFRDFTVKEKILGVGPEMLRSYYAELTDYFSRKILVAHSEPLQILLTTGIAGFLCWAVIWGSVIGIYLKNSLWKHEAIAFVLPLAAYLGQSLVNSPQTTNVAILCVMFACFRLHTKEEKISP